MALILYFILTEKMIKYDENGAKCWSIDLV